MVSNSHILMFSFKLFFLYTECPNRHPYLVGEVSCYLCSGELASTPMFTVWKTCRGKVLQRVWGQDRRGQPSSHSDQQNGQSVSDGLWS